MNKKNIIGILIILLIVIIVFFIFTTVMVVSNNKKSNNDYCDKVIEKLELVINGDYIEANMQFIDNYNNKAIINNYLNLSKEMLEQNGFVEYIQSTDYKLAFYNKVIIEEVSINKETDDEIYFDITVKRPNMYVIMNECDKENADNSNYNFNTAFIDKIKTEDFKYEEGTYTIKAHKIDDDIKFEYDETFAEMLYGEK